MSRRPQIILLAAALIIVNAFTAAGRAARQAQTESPSPVRIDKAAESVPAPEDVMRDVIPDDAHATKGVPAGTWGGEHAEMKVSERSATVEFDCAHASIPRRVVLDSRGRFDAVGTYVEEHGGPVREGARTEGYAARFAGRITGGTMRLTVRRADTGKVIGTFTLARGRESSLVKCR